MSAYLLDRPVHPGANPFFATVGIDLSFRLREVGLAGGDPSVRPVGLMILKVPEAKQVKNRVHLDLGAHDWESEVARLIELGAVQVAEHQEYSTHCGDAARSEGNEFDLGAGRSAT